MMSTYNLTMANPAMAPAEGGGGMAGLPPPPGSAAVSVLVCLASVCIRILRQCFIVVRFYP